MSRGKVLVTGGLGFIGLAVLKLLARHGYALRVLDSLSPQIHGQVPDVDRSLLAGLPLEVFRGDVVRRDHLAECLSGVDYVVHLAAETGTAQSMYGIAHYNRVNSQGTAELLDWMVNHRHSIKKLILTSSRSVYGEGAYRCPSCGIVTPDSRRAESLAQKHWEPLCPICRGELQLIATPESSRSCPASIYAATKLAQEDLTRIACGSAGIPYTILRLQNVYGPGQSLTNPYTGILSIFSTRIRQGLHLPIFEDGLESRDFVHVSDVARALVLCMETARVDGKTLNVGSGIPTSVLSVAEMLSQVVGGSSRTELTGQYRVGDIRHCYADISEIQAAIGFRPEISLEEGLADLAAWVTSQPLAEDGLDQANRILTERGLMK